MILTVPDCRQKWGFDCGAACVRAVLGFYGQPARIPAGWPSPIDGTDPRIVEPYLRHLGFGVQSGEMTLADLRHHTRQRRPVMALLQMYGAGHWVVVRGVVRGGVHYHDPNEGPGVMRAAELETRWRDVARDGTTYQRWGIAVG